MTSRVFALAGMRNTLRGRFFLKRLTPNDALHSCEYTTTVRTNLLDDGIGRYLGVRRRYEDFARQTITRPVLRALRQ
jgi:hypothetical protein